MNRIRTRFDGLGDVLEPGDIYRVKMTALDHATIGIDEALRREFFDERMQDAHMHRPGFRTAANVRPGISRTDAAPAIEAAYRARWQEDVTAWRDGDPAELLSEARRSAATSDPRNGRSDPSERLYQRFRAEQSARPFEHDVPDDDDELEGEEVCPHCGALRGSWSRSDDDQVDVIVRKTQAGVESLRRADVPDSLQHAMRLKADKMASEYATYDEALRTAYKHSDDGC
jgi:hypothetical protein